MKSINIAAIVILGFACLSNEKQGVDTLQVHIPVVEPGQEVAVVLDEPTADTFSRPRKPCPPSGPGRR